MNPGQYANKEQEIQHLKAENARLRDRNEELLLEILSCPHNADLREAREENARLRGREVVWREMEQKYAAVLAENARLREAKRQALVVQAHESQRANNFENENARLRQALENLAELDTDWTLDLDENMSRARAAARHTLRKGGRSG